MNTTPQQSATPTPRTDAALVEKILCTEGGDEECTVYPAIEHVEADFARQLETELAAARAALTQTHERELDLRAQLQAKELESAEAKTEIADQTNDLVAHYDVIVKLRQQLAASDARSSSTIAGLRDALYAYRKAYTPDGHSKPHDCFATGPMTGNKFLDYVACPGCVAQQLGDKALAQVPPPKPDAQPKDTQ